MSGELATQESLAGVVEQVVVGGDLAKLTAKDRLNYYHAICKSVGLNPLTRPFSYLTLSGRLVLYANRDATDQLRKINGVSIEKLERETVEGVYTVTAYARDASGRVDSAIGAVPIENLKGEAKANSMMKAETKAKRRVTLSICGLGMLDETETGSIPDARPVQIDYDTGEVLDEGPPVAHIGGAPVVVEADAPLDEERPIDVERAIMYGKVEALAHKIGLDANARSVLWLEHCGLAKKSNVDPAALHAMYAALLITQKAKKDRAEMSRAEGHEVTVITLDGSAKVYAGAAFAMEENGVLQVWRTDGTLVVLYAPGQWRAVMATGSGLGPES